MFSRFLRSLKNFAGSGPWIALALFVSLALPLSARAQDTGYISGTVTDKTGAVIAGAEVTLKNVTGSVTRTTTTNSEGAYVIPGLAGDTYNLSVTAKGFQKFTAQHLVLNVAEKQRVDVTLTVGTVAEEVVVTGEAVAQVDTASAEIGTTITGKQINQLSLNGRNFTQLVTLTPGVVNQTGSDEGQVGVYGNVNYAINGGRVEYNNWELDGGDNMDNGSNSTLNVYPNPEAIAEFKVLTSNYGAQYGRNGSGTIEVETKSGGSTFHGSAFEYLRNDMFNARPWESGADPEHPNPPYKKHDFGYTFGGPVYIPNHYNSDKKKTFFFWSQEWRREKNPTPFSQKVPSDAERAGDFTDICSNPDLSAECPNVADPSAVPIDPNAQLFLAMIPHANTTDGGLPAYKASVSLPTTWREELIRIDHNLSDNYRLTFRYIHDSWSTVTPTPLWGNGASFPTVNTNFVGPGTSFVARMNANISPTLLNEFVASYTADHIILNAVPTIASTGYTGGSLFPNQTTLFDGKLPSFSLDNGEAYGGGFQGDTGYFPWKNANPSYTYRDNLTKIVGNHTLQMGAYFAAVQKNQQNSLYTQGILSFDESSPISSGNSFADLLMGNIAGVTQADRMIIFYDRYKILEPYFQDDWRVTRKLTLNLGLRWSFFGRYQERYNQEYGLSPSLYNAANAPGLFYNTEDPSDPTNGALTNPTTGEFLAPNDPLVFNGYIQCGAGGAPKGCLKNKYMNPAPRFGFAWDPRGDGKMAIRGGYGIFFEHQNGNEANAESLQQGASPIVLISSQSNVVGYGNIGGGQAFPIHPWSIPDRATWPYVQQWNLSVQKEIPAHFVVSVAYVGSKGTHLTNQRDLNQLHAFTGANPFAPGQPLTDGDCANIFDESTGLPNPSATLGNGTPVPAGALNNLFVACGNNANFVRPLAGYDSINRIETSANSIYHALQVSTNRTVGDLTFSLSYTYSHSIDDSSDRFDGDFTDSYNLRLARASSSFDLRHNLVMSYIYNLPFFRQAGLAHQFLGGWSVSGITTIQTGTPFTVTNDSGFGDPAGLGNGLVASTGSRPDLVGDPHSGLSQSEFPDQTGPLYYNPAAFAVPTGLTYGNLGRNTLRMPGRTNFDFGIFKRWSLGESRAIDFRWEAFNLFNHTQFNSIQSNMDTTDPGGSPDSSGFLHLNGAHAPRRMQFGLRFQF
jgi:hypothetical protein